MALSFGGYQNPAQVNPAVQPQQYTYGQVQQPVNPQYQPTGMPQGNVQQPGANGLYPYEQGDAMYQNATGQWQQPTNNAQWDANKQLISSQVNAGTATPSMQGWYDKWSSRMGQNGDVVNQSTGQVTPNPTTNPAAPQYGLAGAENALNQGLQQGTNAINQGVTNAQQTMSPYTQGGNGAFNQQAALTGAMGPESQAQAYANYQESPGQAYLREQGEKAITRNASATGGLGGGNVLQELQRHGIGLAAQDFQNSFNRLGSVADKGYGASTMLGGFQANAGNNIGQMAYGTGANIASARNDAGKMIGDNMQGTTSALSNLINQQGAGAASMTGDTGSNLAGIISQFGQQQGLNQQQLAALLANIATGSGTQVAGLSGIPGTQQTPGKMGDIGTAIAAGASLFSDSRLKKNITRIGKTPAGINLYSWDWNLKGEALAGGMPTVGVIAQEVIGTGAVSVDDNGYLMVDYGRIF